MVRMGTSVLGESPCKGFPTVTCAIVSAYGKWVFEEIKLETLPRGGAGERSRPPYQPATQNKQLSSVASPPAVYNFAAAICRGDRCEPPDFVRPAPTRQKCATTAARISTRSTTTPPHAAVHYKLCTSVIVSDLGQLVENISSNEIQSSKTIRQQLIFVCDNTAHLVKVLFTNNRNIFLISKEVFIYMYSIKNKLHLH